MSFTDIVDKNLLQEDIMDPRWIDSPFFMLKSMKPKQAGSRYEKIVSDILTKLGYHVAKAQSTQHDLCVNGELVEIKGSMLSKGYDSDYFSFLQFRPQQQYEKLILLTIDFVDIKMYSLTKEDLLNRIANGVVKKQHGGNAANSGTYCYNGPMYKLNAKEITQ